MSKITVLIISMLLFGIYQGFMAIKINNHTENVVKGIYLRKLGIVNFGYSLQPNLVDILIKFCINYF